jgi:hypothetical protein
MSKKVKTKAVKMCGECNKKESVMIRYDTRICNDCSSLDKYTSICKSTAIKDYKLTETDLETVEYREVKNPHYRSASNMKLYKLSDIKTAFCNKHNITEDKINITLKKLKEPKPKNMEKRSEANVEKRKKGFLRKLQKNNLEIDEDDYTSDVENYINNGKGTINNIIQPYIRKQQLIDLIGLEKYEESQNESIIQQWIDDGEEDLTKINQFILRKDNLICALGTIDSKKPVTYEVVMDGKSDISSKTAKEYLKYGYPELHVLLETGNRRRQLRESLQKYGLEIRSDSMYCSEFINEDKRSLREVVNMAREMHFFFSNTNYKDVIRNLMRESHYDKYEHRYHRRRYDTDSDSEDDGDRMNISEQAKNIVLHEWVKNGKRGMQPPEHMKDRIEQIEKRIQNELINKHKKDEKKKTKKKKQKNK